MIYAKLHVFDNGYFNDDAIEKLIHYVYRLSPDHFFGYGFWPQTEESAKFTFENLRNSFPENTCGQKVQHLVLSFGSNIKDMGTVLNISNEVATIFQPWYPICFASHDDTGNLHTHFAISTTSQIPGCPPLTGKTWKTFLDAIHHFAGLNQISLKEMHKKCLSNTMTF